MIKTTESAFKKALLDVVLSEYKNMDQKFTNSGNARGSVKLYTIWVDKKNKLLYSFRKDSCVQKLFHNQEQLDADIGILEMQGYTRK